MIWCTDDKKFREWDGTEWKVIEPKGDTIYNFRNSDSAGSTARTHILYRWDGQDLTEISASVAIGETTGTAYDGAKGKANRDALNTLNQAIGKLDKGLNDLTDNTGVGDYPTFSASTAYSAGDVVNYQGKLYQFTADHAAGAWTRTDVEETNTTKEISSFILRQTTDKAYATLGKNLFNKYRVKEGYFLNSKGDEQKNAAYAISDYILVEADTEYTKSVNDVNAYTAFYDENINVLSAVNTKTFTTPKKTKYLRFSDQNSHLEKLQLEKGSVVTNYVPYTADAAQQLQITKLEVEKLTTNPGKNLFNKDAVNKGYYINDLGRLVENDSYFVSDYIPFNGQNLIISGKNKTSSLYIEFLDENLNQLKIQAGNILTCEFSDGYAYMRFSEAISNIDRNIQVEYGTEATAYEPYTPFVGINEQAKQYDQNETSKNKALFILKEMGKNLLDPAAIQPDAWISDKNGTISEMDYGFCVSGLIPISEGQSLIASVVSGNFFQCRAMLYDKDLNVLFVSSEATTSDNTITITYVEGAAYAVFTFRNKDVVSIQAQVEVGSEATDYEPFIARRHTRNGALPLCPPLQDTSGKVLPLLRPLVHAV